MYFNPICSPTISLPLPLLQSVSHLTSCFLLKFYNS